MSDDERNRIETEDQFRRRYWVYANRPYNGCGCLWLLLTIFIFYLIISLLYAPLRFGYW